MPAHTISERRKRRIPRVGRRKRSTAAINPIRRSKTLSATRNPTRSVKRRNKAIRKGQR